MSFGVSQRKDELCSRLVRRRVTIGATTRRIAVQLDQAMLKFCSVWDSATDIIGESLIDHACQTRVDIRTQLVQRREAERCFSRRITSGDRVVHGRAKGVNVRARLDLTPVLLRWCIPLSPDHRRVGERLEMPRDAEID